MAKPTPGNPNWREVTNDALAQVRSTGQVYPFAAGDVGGWIGESSHVSGVWISSTSLAPLGSTSDLSTSAPTGRMLTERSHETGARRRYDRYLLVQMVDGRVFQAGPYKNVDFGHHHDDRPDWLNAYTTRDDA